MAQQEILLEHSRRILIDNIKRCMLEYEVNRENILPYPKQWVDKFLMTISNRGSYNVHEQKILSEIRDSVMGKLQNKY